MTNASIPERTGRLGAVLDRYARIFLQEPGKLEPALTATRWPLVAAWLGFALALARLGLVSSPDVCYLFAKNRVHGFEHTLPEAMASVRQWCWFALLIEPPLVALLLSGIARVSSWFARILGGGGNLRLHLGAVTAGAAVVVAGRLAAYAAVASTGLAGLSDLRDLTPGVGLALLPWFSLERIGPVFWELLRSLDLFGIWAIALVAALFRGGEHMSGARSFLLAGGYYGAFIALRWLLEGPGERVWRYFWTAGTF